MLLLSVKPQNTNGVTVAVKKTKVVVIMGKWGGVRKDNGGF